MDLHHFRFAGGEIAMKSPARSTSLPTDTHFSNETGQVQGLVARLSADEPRSLFSLFTGRDVTAWKKMHAPLEREITGPTPPLPRRLVKYASPFTLSRDACILPRTTAITWDG